MWQATFFIFPHPNVSNHLCKSACLAHSSKKFFHFHLKHPGYQIWAIRNRLSLQQFRLDFRPSRIARKRQKDVWNPQVTDNCHGILICLHHKSRGPMKCRREHNATTNLSCIQDYILSQHVLQSLIQFRTELYLVLYQEIQSILFRFSGDINNILLEQTPAIM
jgi:hypothetical protein